MNALQKAIQRVLNCDAGSNRPRDRDETCDAIEELRAAWRDSSERPGSPGSILQLAFLSHPEAWEDQL